MARRAFVWLLPTFLALILAFGAAPARRGLHGASVSSIAKTFEQEVDGRAAVLADDPLDGGKAAAFTNQWNDDDDHDNVLQASVASLPAPVLTAGVGRRVSSAILRQHLVSSAFPRGPPAA